ncbi:hypothetical protein FQN55_005503 [Onygenales sp. PD_40]|nr:hypothetical protein FQN55_005503 [Onygenales sp. PD_40]KAK2756024.1 hypothetical protein FQN53_008750 [Emmonsiellopsis sp. PD_33]KAK2790372.1 hypothetical protein FQN52_005640 [Onygenales sp. PD_12]KAK2797946.1 hypothetical protein FQN51_008125 [Onygenales sp. PD_10]
MSNPPKLRSLYRSVLRELPHRPLSSPSPLQTRIRSYLASAPPSSDTKRAQTTQAQIEEAEQFTQYLKAQRVYVTLLERYNPGADMDEEERVRLTARRVGMELPVKGEEE